MIELKSNENLYYIENVGCDDETHGIAIISNDDFPKFKEIIKNLNKNSTYGCMPTIHIYKINPIDVRETVEGDDNVDDRLLYLNDKTYIGVNGTYQLYEEGEKII